ncbi:MAG: hypothetical protein KGN78_14125 [Actinomycetales bacterium]|nr:hypothetical protein [Actinomycetales bacterium]
MILGIVACSAKKMPTPCPAWLLYSASPSFSQAYLAAQADCDRVMILSGRHGLIHPDTVIAPYDQRIDPSRPGLAEEIAMTVSSARASEVVSYCPGDYRIALRLVPHRNAASGGIFEKAKALGKRGSVKGSVFPMRESLLWLFSHSGATLSEFRQFCLQTWQNTSTRQCQYNRLIKSPFARVLDGRIYYKFNLKRSS